MSNRTQRMQNGICKKIKASISTQTDPLSDEELMEMREDSPTMLAELTRPTESHDDANEPDDCQRDLDDVEFEEVTLYRCTISDQIGLTLCYGGPVIGDAETDIYISAVDPGSIADLDGRIREGDQILQINGFDVYTRDQAIGLFKSNKNEVRLLVARPTLDLQSTTADEEHRLAEETEMLNNDITSLSLTGCLGLLPTKQLEQEHEGDHNVNKELARGGDSATDGSNDSGISRATEESEADLPTSPQVEVEMPLPQSQKQATIPSNVKREATVDMRQEEAIGPTPRGSSLERELHALHTEMQTIRLECDRLISKHVGNEKKALQQMAKAQHLMVTMDSMAEKDAVENDRNNSACGVDNRTLKSVGSQKVEKKHRRSHLSPINSANSTPSTPLLLRRTEDTSSAYHTGGDSCRSTPRQQLRHPHPQQHMMPVDNTVNHQLRQAQLAPPPSMPPASVPTSNVPNVVTLLHYHMLQQLQQTSQQQTAANQNGGASHHRYQTTNTLPSALYPHHPQQAPFSVLPPPPSSAQFQPGDTMYTRAEHLQMTILLQQRLLREAMLQQAEQLKGQQTLAPDGGANQSTSMYQALQDQVDVTQWKLKRRSDGSRYITKRLVRNRLLERRAAELFYQRIGISTDDDAISELKTGRCWSQEDRRKHAESARRRKARLHELLQRKAAQTSVAAPPADEPIVRLAHNKARRRHIVFDHFTTLHEHLARRHSQPTPQLGILSVTTV